MSTVSYKINYSIKDFNSQHNTNYKNWLNILENEKNLSEEELTKIIDRVIELNSNNIHLTHDYWFMLATKYSLSEEFIQKYFKYFNNTYTLCHIIRNQNLSYDFIEKNKSNIDWYYIFEYRQESEEFIKKYKKYYKPSVWTAISEKQNLSEDFIRKNKSKVKWNKISKFQKLSKEFCLEFKYMIDWNILVIENKNFNL